MGKLEEIRERLEVCDKQIVSVLEDRMDIIKEIMEYKKEIAEYLKSLGYVYIALDLEGFRSGSMDQNIEAHDRED